ncbi:hypothetical protein E1B28_005651 [Marasmius oreades]|uniref:Response regulatory domain-containing protein n=1 Tax=Marasmius oreades TaxID=181124 RepID=A0A9P7S3W8_9AGAR|nr:uncharacterized protein E1B28_005651 [Marasmius oreades]KAG7094842.1 hypothetical protein E1B28_005651 [Marasmius oreades]
MNSTSSTSTQNFSEFPLPSHARNSSTSSHWPSDNGAYYHQQNSHHNQVPIQPRPQIKREPQPILPLLPDHKSNLNKQEMEDSMPATSDFVKKLYKMLEDKSFQHVVCWGPAGDCFVVKDMNEFTKSILPKLFKHSNFASFVRQLNKYDFHKVKNTDDNSFGEHAWTFRHPDFHADRREALENIKRKVPTSRKSTGTSSVATTRPLADGQSRAGGSGSRSGSPGPSGYYGQGQGHYSDSYQINTLQTQIDRLTASHEELSSHIRSLERNIGGLERNLGGLERNYHEVLVEMVGFQRNMSQQDTVMQGLVEWVLRTGPGGGEGKGKGPALDLSSSSTSQLDFPPSTSTAPSAASLPSLPNFSQPQRSPPFGDSTSAPPPPDFRDAKGKTASTTLNELSRRVNELGPQGSSGSSERDPMQRPPSRIWTAAANAGLINPDGTLGSGPGSGPGSGTGAGEFGVGFGGPTGPGSGGNGQTTQMGPGGTDVSPRPVKITSRQEALERIEELQKMRPASAGFLSNAAAKLVGGLDMFGMLRSTGQLSTSREEQRTEKERNEDRNEGSSSEMEDMVMPTTSSGAGRSSSQQHQGGYLLGAAATSATRSGPWSHTGERTASTSSTSPSSASDPASSSLFQDFASTGMTLNDHAALEVYTVGHLMPKSAVDDMSGNWSFDNSLMGSGSGNTRLFNGGSTGGTKKLSVRRSTFVPGWTVSPRVLLVDDDAVSRKLSSKFLQVFGCKIDIAVDGVGAVNKMNLEKYDLVLMDIVMPKLDGVSATSMIRKFDHMTPIISMTSNAKPNEIMTYYSSGMNDILPKPFTKQGMLDMLEKHLMHLKVIQQMSRVPRSLGIPPLSDASFEQAMTSQAALFQQQQQQQQQQQNMVNGLLGIPPGSPSSSSGMLFDPGNPSLSLTTSNDRDDYFTPSNPFAGMGLTDEQYNTILAGLVSGESFSGSMGVMGMPSNNFDSSGGMGQKRPLDDRDLSMRSAKRGRFEVVE